MIRSRWGWDRNRGALNSRDRVVGGAVCVRHMVCAADIDDVMGILIRYRGMVRIFAVTLCVPLFLPELLGALIGFNSANRIQIVDVLNRCEQIA